MLTGKDKSRLRALGQKMPDDARLGKEGLSEGFVANLRELLRRKELVKLRLAEIEGVDRKELAEQAAGAAEAELVAVVGRTALLYRANPELEASSARCAPERVRQSPMRERGSNVHWITI